MKECSTKKILGKKNPTRNLSKDLPEFSQGCRTSYERVLRLKFESSRNMKEERRSKYL